MRERDVEKVLVDEVRRAAGHINGLALATQGCLTGL